jgi:peptide/nickel transport system permease protein
MLGVLAALYRNSLFDRVVNAATLTTISMPEFFMAYLLMLFLSVKLHWFPSLASVDLDTPMGERLLRCTLRFDARCRG